MATFSTTPRFDADYAALSRDERERFKRAVSQFVDDLKAGRRPRPGLRVKRVQRTERIREMTFAPDGRATFEFGDPVRESEPHAIWRRVGTHEVLHSA